MNGDIAMRNKIIGTGALVLGLIWYGASAARAESAMRVLHQPQEISQPQAVAARGVVMLVTRASFSHGYRLGDMVQGSSWGNKCILPPQTFHNIKEDGEFYYALSQDNYFKPSKLNRMKGLDQCLCGVKFSKTNLEIDETYIELPNGDRPEMGFDGGNKPRMEEVNEMETGSPNYLRKTLYFDSFSDDFIALRLMEERGAPNGYNALGVYVITPPTVTQRIHEFDLQTSRIIEIAGARMEVVDARSDELVVRILRRLAAD